MTVDYLQLKRYLPSINRLPNPTKIDKGDLINEKFLIEKASDIEIYYAPHNEYINRDAKIVIVGITPGWTQMKAAFQEAKVCLQQDATLIQLMKSSKRAAGFAGTMRTNLIEMLDACGVNDALQLSTSQLLFSQCQNLMHTTSLIKYPVFIKGKNYTGHTPKITQSSLLTEFAYQVFPKEIEEMKNDILLIPLGKAVSEVVKELVNQGNITEYSCLFGFPHPSGANGHRKRQFEMVKPELQRIVKKYANQFDQSKTKS